jgi:integrase
MEATKLTQGAVDALKLRKGSSEEIIFDNAKGGVPGLGLRIREGGSRKWIFQYRFAGQQRRQTIGTAAAMTLEAARKRARAMRVDVDDGVDPKAEKATRIEASKTVFKSVMESYLDAREHTPKLLMKPRSFAECRRHLENHWKPLHKLPIAGITRFTIADRLRGIAKDSGPVAADRARSTLSSMFVWAIGEGLCDVNPVIGTNKASDDKERERVLSDAELVSVWNGAPDNDYGRIVKLLLLTGQRRDEIGSMQRSELDIDAKMLKLSAARTKNSRAHDVPLSQAAIKIMEGIEEREGRDLVFGNGEGGYSGWSHSKAAMDKAVGLKDAWTLHDLRRTVRTGMGKLGVAPHIAEAVLNHLPAKLIRTYDKNKYEVEKRQALDLWAAHVEAVLAGKVASNVLRMKA